MKASYWPISARIEVTLSASGWPGAGEFLLMLNKIHLAEPEMPTRMAPYPG
jgi:hypothetical protein